MFSPWVGEKYSTADNGFGGKRVLIVGESHHSEEHPIGAVVPDMTKEVFKIYLDGTSGRWRRTFDNQAWAISGKGPAPRQLDGSRTENAVWNSLAFYNYIPHVLAKFSREDRPKAEQMRAGKEPFEKVLQDLQPDYLIVWGYRLFPWVVFNHHPAYEGHPWEFKGDWLNFSPLNFSALRMLHPSAAYSPSAWSTVIQQKLPPQDKAPWYGEEKI